MLKKKKKLRQSKKSESRPYARLYWDIVHARCDNGILASYENAPMFKDAYQSMKGLKWHDLGQKKKKTVMSLKHIW